MADFPVDRNLDVAYHPHLLLHLSANDAETAGRLPRRGRNCNLGAGITAGVGVLRRRADKNHGPRLVRLHESMQPCKLNALLLAGNWIECAAQNVLADVAVEFTAILRNLYQLLIALEGIQQQHTTIGGKPQSGSDFRRARLFGLEFGFKFLIQLTSLCGVGVRGRGAPGVECVRRFPVDQIFRQFLPLLAVGTHVADAVALHLIFRDRLIRTVFQDEAFRGLGRAGKGEEHCKDHERHETGDPRSMC